MAHFFRDEHVTNLTLSEENLKQISVVFASREKTINATVLKDDNTGKRAYFTYIIRFDNKGYRVFSLEELLRYFHQAKEIERIIFTLETGECLRSIRQVGTYMELRLDERDPNSCYLAVTSDDGDWVDSSFSAVQDVLLRCKNKNKWARTDWTTFGVQITGVTLGFVLSLWAAIKISPKLAIENSFIISFLFVLLIFSNTWTYLNQKILSLIKFYFPNLKFYRPSKDRIHWLMQALIGGVAVAITFYILNLVFTYIGDILGDLISK